MYEFEALPRSSYKLLLVKDKVQRSRKQTRKSMESSLDVPEIKVVDPVNDLFWKVLDYRTYWPIKKSLRYDNDVENKLHRMTSDISVQMKDRTLSGKLPMILIAYLL